jgi:gluconolactonase
MTNKTLLTITLAAASLFSALPAASQPQHKPSTAVGLGATGPALDSLCPGAAPQNLDHENIVFEKVLEVEPLTPGFAILEGPAWVDGALLMSHIGASTNDKPSVSNLVALRDGELEVIKASYGANGLTLDPTGAVVAARQADGTITRIADGTVLVDGYQGKRFNSPNDLVFSTSGDLYFTDPDWQAPKPRPQQAERAYHVSPSGKITPFGEGIEKPNGLILSLNERVLYLGGTNGLYRFGLEDTGEVINNARRVQAELIPSGVDGLTLDCAGNLFVTANGKVHILAAGNDGPIASYDIPGVTNVAFGGEDGTTIYATTLGAKPQVWWARSNIPGLPF